MAVRLGIESHEVSDLCLGKPAIVWLPLTVSVADAIRAFKERPSVTELALTSCVPKNHSKSAQDPESELLQCCAGKLCMVDIICFLASDKSLRDPDSALASPVSAVTSSIPGQVRHVDPHFSLLRGLDLMLEGADNLIVPIRSRAGFKKAGAATTAHAGKEFCWITQEDVARFLMGYIGAFAPLASMTIQNLGLMNTEVLAVDADAPASAALNMIRLASQTQTAVAVTETHNGDQNPRLVGEISPNMLMLSHETTALALATLSAGDFVTFLNSVHNPPEYLLELVRQGIRRKIGDVAVAPSEESEEDSSDVFDEDSAVSSDEDSSSSFSSPPVMKFRRSLSMGAATAPVTCRPWSSLVAVMVQALANRMSYVWVTHEDSTLMGIVTFWDILDLFANHLRELSMDEQVDK